MMIKIYVITIKRYVVMNTYIDSFLEKVSKFAGMEILAIIRKSNDYQYEIFIKASNAVHAILERYIIENYPSIK